MIDDHGQAGVALGDQAHFARPAVGREEQWQVMLFRVGPVPVERARVELGTELGGRVIAHHIPACEASRPGAVRGDLLL